AVIHRALAAARIGPGDVDAAYLGGTGDPEQDRCELDLVGAVFEPGRREAPPLTSLTPPAREHPRLRGPPAAPPPAPPPPRGPPGLPDAAEPVRGGFAFAAGPARRVPRRRAVLVHGVARGGGHAALVLTPAA